jgi:hypothetical protein
MHGGIEICPAIAKAGKEYVTSSPQLESAAVYIYSVGRVKFEIAAEF